MRIYSVYNLLMRSSRFAPFLLSATIALGCGGTQGSSQDPALRPPDLRVAATINQWTLGLHDPSQSSATDMRGQVALFYGALATLSPRAAGVVSANITGLMGNVLICAIPLIGYLAEVGCDPDPQILVPTGSAGRALASAGVVGLSEDGQYLRVPPKELLMGVAALSQKRREQLAKRIPAGSCQFEAIETEWQPAPMSDESCGQKGDPERNLCVANMLLWNNWQDDVSRVWLASAICNGEPALFAISARAEHQHRDGVIFTALGENAKVALVLWKQLP